MTEYLCEYQEDRDGALCGAPASRRLTGEKYGEKPWTLLVCDDHRHIAGFVMELRGYRTRKEACLLDCAEGQIAHLEDALLDAVRCFVADNEPQSGAGIEWLDKLLGEAPNMQRYIEADYYVRAALKQAEEFYEQQTEEAVCSGD